MAFQKRWTACLGDLRSRIGHGIALRYVVSRRNASYSDVDYHNQTVGTVSLMYVLLGSSGFGAVEWP